MHLEKLSVCLFGREPEECGAVEAVGRAFREQPHEVLEERLLDAAEVVRG